jgi:hypothetical protein
LALESEKYSLLFNLVVSSTQSRVEDDADASDEGELLGCSELDGDSVADEEDSLELDAGAAVADADEEVSTVTDEDDIVEELSTVLEPVEELSQPPQIVSPGTQIVERVVVVTVLVMKLVLSVGTAVDKTGLIVQEIQSDGSPEGTWICLSSNGDKYR